MRTIGYILPTDDSSLSNSEWLAQIASRDELAGIAGRSVRNPATGERIMAYPKPDNVHVKIDDVIIGSMFWTNQDTGMIVIETVGGKDSQVLAIARDIAESLNGVVGEFPDATQ